MFRYANYQICIFMTINENNRNKRNIVKKIQGCTCKFIYISAAYYPKLPALDLLALVCDV